MNKDALVEELATKAGLTKTKAREVINALFGSAGTHGIIGSRLLRGHNVEITGFGQFGVRNTAARTGRNPATGEPLEIAESVKPTFKFSGSLRAAFRQKYGGGGTPIDAGNDE